MKKIIESTVHSTADILSISRTAVPKLFRNFFDFKSASYIQIGTRLTTLYFSTFIALIISNWEKIKVPVELNGIGDFLAGTFSPVAFLWLVVGYLMQNKELSMNREELIISRKALEKQAEELANSVKQQIEMVRLTQDEIAMSKKAELPKLKTMSAKYYRKGDIIKTKLRKSEAQKNTIQIYLKNTGKSITNSEFSLIINHNIYHSKSIKLDHESLQSYIIEFPEELENSFELFFKFYTNSLDLYIYKYQYDLLSNTSKEITYYDKPLIHKSPLDAQDAAI